MTKAVKFTGTDFVKQVEKALDRATAQLLTSTQSKLSASSPVDTGRLASSWMIGHNNPDTSVASKRTEPSAVTVEKYSSKITYDGDWYVSNNLPYAKRAAYDPGYVGRRGGGAGDWYSQITNQLTTDANRIFQREFRKIK